MIKEIDPFFLLIRYPSRRELRRFESCLVILKTLGLVKRYLVRMDPEIKGIFATITRRGSLTVPRRDQGHTQVLNWPDLLQWFVFLLTEETGFLSR